MVSFPDRTRAQLRSKLVGVAYVVAASLAFTVLLLSPDTSSGRHLRYPPREYELLLGAFGEGDTTKGKGVEEPAGVPEKPRGEEGPPRFGRGDTTAADTTGRPRLPTDSSYVVYLDSTARLKQFTYVRRDGPQAQFFHDRTYILFSNSRPPSYQRVVTFDTASMTMQARETVASQDVKIPVSVPLKEFVAMRRKWEIRKMFAEEARKSKTLGSRNDLGELLTNITQIHIPVPANPIFSIFGKPEIKLNISGAVDIKAGFRNTKSDQTQLSSLDQSRNEPDFSQEVQVNVNGTIGDKLNILADWNTQRTFEYENQLKIKYTGYDDEIVQSVEAGNVSLQTPSSFVGSSQALFGVKAKFQTGPLTLTT
ncbi:MAG: hypothetical protein HY708_05735, partial [Ignavibacteriae bacterium]|nr:hypothetical protein [Ignavibacteriota bacterium]